MIDNVTKIEDMIDAALNTSNIIKTLHDTDVPSVKRAEHVIVLKGVTISEEDRRELRTRYVTPSVGWKAIMFTEGVMKAKKIDDATRLTLKPQTKEVQVKATRVTLVGFETVEGE